MILAFQNFTLAGLGAMLLGVGSALSGWAALKAARRGNSKKEEAKEVQDELPK